MNDELVEEIYINELERCRVKSQEDKFYHLKETFYRLKQALRAWYNKIDAYLIQQGFVKRVNEATLYVKIGEHFKQLIFSLYVDDMLVMGNDSQIVKHFKTTMEEMFNMLNLEKIHYFLSMELFQVKGDIFLSQIKYA